MLIVKLIMTTSIYLISKVQLRMIDEWDQLGEKTASSVGDLSSSLDHAASAREKEKVLMPLPKARSFPASSSGSSSSSSSSSSDYQISLAHTLEHGLVDLIADANIDELTQINENLIKNQAQILSLDQDMAALTTLNSKLHSRLSKLELLRGTQPKLDKLPEAIQVLIAMNDELLVLKTMIFMRSGRIELPRSEEKALVWWGLRKGAPDFGKRLRELGSIVDHEVEVHELMVKMGDSIVDRLIKLFRNDQVFSFDLSHDPSSTTEYQITLLLCWKSALKTLDFLHRFHLLHRDSLKKFFSFERHHGSSWSKQLIHYLHLRFMNLQESSTPSLSQSWHWSRLHRSFKALDKEQEDMLNAYFATEIRKS